jgi:hypothetical protein
VGWLGFTTGVFRQIDEAEKPKVDYSKASDRPESARSDTFYTGSYANSYYGPLAVAEANGGPDLEMEPAGVPPRSASTTSTAIPSALTLSERPATAWPGQSSPGCGRRGIQRTARLLRPDRAGHLHPQRSTRVLP